MRYRLTNILYLSDPEMRRWRLNKTAHLLQAVPAPGLLHCLPRPRLSRRVRLLDIVIATCHRQPTAHPLRRSAITKCEVEACPHLRWIVTILILPCRLAATSLPLTVTTCSCHHRDNILACHIAMDTKCMDFSQRSVHLVLMGTRVKTPAHRLIGTRTDTIKTTRPNETARGCDMRGIAHMLGRGVRVGNRRGTSLQAERNVLLPEKKGHRSL
jgi:hypothetical protein